MSATSDHRQLPPQQRIDAFHVFRLTTASAAGR